MDFLDFREPVSAWSHALGVILAVPGTALLWRRCGTDRGLRASVLAYGLGLLACYGASASYHAVHAAEPELVAYRRLDHVGILALIAGSYSPVAWGLLRGRWRWGTLGLAWLAALVGAARHLSSDAIDPWGATALYLAMGWGAVFCYSEIAHVLAVRQLRMLLIGGMAYSVGAVFHVTRRPALWPGVFGPHELFHLFVLAGSLAHFRFMWSVVVPFAASRRAAAPAPSWRLDRGRAARPGWLRRRPGRRPAASASR